MSDVEEEEMFSTTDIFHDMPAIAPTQLEEKAYEDESEGSSDDSQLNCGCAVSTGRPDKNFQPYTLVGELEVICQPGKIIIIKGLVKPEAIRMSVNFVCGFLRTSDLALHLHPYFDENMIVRNCRIDQNWGKEETCSSKRFPYKRNEEFQMQIFLTYDNFLVAFDGEHYCGFTYRIPLKRIQFVQVAGDVDMVQIDQHEADRYPMFYEGLKMQRYIIYRKRALSFYNNELMAAPVTVQLGEGLYEGSEIEINGKVKLLPFTFHINLQGGTQVWPHPVVALHINPQFLSDEKSHVIQNACLKGKWGKEEKATFSRFRPGTSFSMKISCQRGRYAMSVDGKPPGFFIQRCPPNVVNAVYIHGDVWINDILYTRTVKSRPGTTYDGIKKTNRSI